MKIERKRKIEIEVLPDLREVYEDPNNPYIFNDNMDFVKFHSDKFWRVMDEVTEFLVERQREEKK